MNETQKLLNLTKDLQAASTPIEGVSLLNPATTPPTVSVQYRVLATPAQILAGNALVAGFDWSDASYQARLVIQQRTDAKASLNFPEPDYKLLRALASILVDEINVLRAAVSPALPARTLAQVRTAIQNRIDGGLIDI